jgi:hypothetical protein
VSPVHLPDKFGMSLFDVPGVSREAAISDHHPLNKNICCIASQCTARKEQQHIMIESPDIRMVSDKGPDGAGEEGSKDTDCELEPL